MKIEFEVHDRSSTSLPEIKAFWITEWNKVFQQLINSNASVSVFEEYEYHYILKFDGKIGAIMSSTWQNIDQNFETDPYYSSLPEAKNYLRFSKIKKFHKMGMIAANKDIVPKDFKLTRVIIGCGLKFTESLTDCDGVVSFPRPDTSVYKACVEWGARTLKDGLTMYNVPVNFILVLHKELRPHHSDDSINAIINNLWSSRNTRIKMKLSA